MKKFLLEKYKAFIDKLDLNPKFYIKIGAVILIVIILLTFIVDLRNINNKKTQISTLIPYSVYNETENVTSMRKEQELNDKKRENIIKELKTYKDKYDNGLLEPKDSIRIEYLYNEYYKIK